MLRAFSPKMANEDEFSTGKKRISTELVKAYFLHILVYFHTTKVHGHYICQGAEFWIGIEFLRENYRINSKHVKVCSCEIS